MKQMGAPDPFDDFKANFKGINEKQGQELRISQVIHQAFVEVNEEGTEAAAATAVEMTRCYMGPGKKPKQPFEFICNRPFIFLIHENQRQNILFMGKCMNPNA